MTKAEEAIEVIKQDIPCEHDSDLIEALEMAIEALKQKSVLDRVRAEIQREYEKERSFRSVFREEKNAVKAEQCTGSILAFHSVIGLIDKYKTESEVWA